MRYNRRDQGEKHAEREVQRRLGENGILPTDPRGQGGIDDRDSDFNDRVLFVIDSNVCGLFSCAGFYRRAGGTALSMYLRHSVGAADRVSGLGRAADRGETAGRGLDRSAGGRHGVHHSQRRPQAGIGGSGRNVYRGVRGILYKLYVLRAAAEAAGRAFFYPRRGLQFQSGADGDSADAGGAAGGGGVQRGNPAGVPY